MRHLADAFLVKNAGQKKVYERDNYTCQWCGSIGTWINLMQAHHILGKKEFPHWRRELINGITLCRDRCHKLADKGVISVSELLQIIENLK